MGIWHTPGWLAHGNPQGMAPGEGTGVLRTAF